MNFKKMTTLLGLTVACSGTLMTAGTAFAAQATDTHQETPVNATITVDKLPDAVIPTPTPGGDDKTDSDNTDVNQTTADVAIAYQPVAFTGSAKVAGTPTADLTMPLQVTDTNGGHASTKGHVGVRDTTKKSNNWVLNGSFTNVKGLDGANVKLNGGAVKLNNAGTLSALGDAEVTGNATVTLGSNASPIMQAAAGKVQYGIYDYGFDNAQLVIPQATAAKLATGQTYTGTVNWDLSNTPAP